jgi:predicted alpha/beta-fold hydrolase
MGEVSIDYDVFKNNPNVVLATNKYGGHLGYHESIFTMEQWFSKPCIDFLDSLRNQQHNDEYWDQEFSN